MALLIPSLLLSAPPARAFDWGDIGEAFSGLFGGHRHHHHHYFQQQQPPPQNGNQQPKPQDSANQQAALTPPKQAAVDSTKMIKPVEGPAAIQKPETNPEAKPLEASAVPGLLEAAPAVRAPAQPGVRQIDGITVVSVPVVAAPTIGFARSPEAPSPAPAAPDQGDSAFLSKSVGEIKADPRAQSPQVQSDALVTTAKTKIKMGDYAGAAQEAGKALTLNPGNAEAYARRAEAENHLKQYTQAEKDALTALQLDKNHSRAAQNAAWAELKQGKYRDALYSSTRAAELNPNDATNFAIRAYAKDSLGDRANAVADLETAALLDRRFTEKLAQAKEGGKIYDPDDDESSLLGTVSSARGGSSGWLPLAGLGALALVVLGSLAGAFRHRRKTALIAAAPAAALPQAPIAAPQNGGRMVGKYELVRVIGRGGMGQVYEARDLSLGRPVAIKKMSEQLADIGPQARALFLKEARTVAALHHPAIVDIYEIIEQGSDLYLVFEFVRGKTVSHLLAESRKLALSRALEILRPVCQALDFAHGQNLVHRDLKPANIMVTDQGHIKLMDFGIARSLAEAGADGAVDSASRKEAPARAAFARTAMIVGTPSYMAPETEQGIVCREADVYALGVTLYEMLTGRLPFSPVADAVEKAAMQFAWPSHLTPELPSAVDELMAQALQPNRENRLKTPREFLTLLEAAART